MAPDRITLYRAPTEFCDVDEIGDWVSDRIDARVGVSDRFLEVHTSEGIHESFARARVLSPFDRATGSTMYGILRYEERILEDPNRGGGVMYDGQTLQRALNGTLPDDERALDHLHIIFTHRIIGTWGEHDGRWHKRITVLGQPTLISVPGVAEAPAKPESYYQKKHQSALVTGDAPPRELLDATIEEDVLLPNDPRTTEVLKGYVLSAFDVIDTGGGFCDDPQCRLSNPHRHEGVIRAQLTEPEFCRAHADRYQ